MKQILSIILLLLRFTSFSQPLAGIIASSQNNVVYTPTYMYGNIFQESFEGTGYQNSFTETIGANSGNIVDEDNTDVTITGGGSQVLKIVKVITPTNTVAASTAQTYTGYLSTMAISAYVDFYVYISSYSLPSDGNLNYIAKFNDDVNNTAISVYIRNLSSLKRLYVSVYNNGANPAYAFPSSTDLVVDHWYHIQCKYDVTNLKYHIIVDDTVLANDIALTGTTRTGVKRVFFGDNAGVYPYSIYLDRVNISTTTFFVP